LRRSCRVGAGTCGGDVRLELTDRSVNLTDKAFDIGIWFGTVPDSRMVARKLVSNERMLCASSDYLRRAGIPQVPRDLQSHQCIVLRESDAAYGTWYLTRGSRQETIKVRGVLSTNDGETGVLWALAGYGILMRSEWDVHEHMRAGRLVLVLADWALPVADIFAVYPERANLSAKVSAFIEFLTECSARKQRGPRRAASAASHFRPLFRCAVACASAASRPGPTRAGPCLPILAPPG
jgi:DNA-binding transcriptional LysR family regulator